MALKTKTELKQMAKEGVLKETLKYRYEQVEKYKSELQRRADRIQRDLNEIYNLMKKAQDQFETDERLNYTIFDKNAIGKFKKETEKEVEHVLKLINVLNGYTNEWCLMGIQHAVEEGDEKFLHFAATGESINPNSLENFIHIPPKKPNSPTTIFDKMVEKYTIIYASESMLPKIKELVDKNKKTFGFVTRGALLESIQKEELIVAVSKFNSAILGFVRFHHRRDEQTTIYDICVAEEVRRRGVGRRLIEKVKEVSKRRGKKVILLKCPEDEEANMFYDTIGFSSLKIEEGKSRRLKVWILNNH